MGVANERGFAKTFVEAIRTVKERIADPKKLMPALLTTAALAIGGTYPLATVDQIAGPAATAQVPVAPPKTAAATPAAPAETAASSTFRILFAASSAVQNGVAEAGATVQQAVSPDAAAEDYRIVTHGVQEAFFSSKIPFGSVILREAKKNDLAPELVAAVIKQESKFQPHARSSAGAMGLMQLEPRTGRRMGARNLLDPAQNIAAGAKYLRDLSDEFGGNEKKVIAAYNAGEGNVKKFGGTPPFKQTRDYVHKVLRYRNEFASSVAAAAADPQPGM